MHLDLKFNMPFYFDYILYTFWDINDNYFNWPINELRNQQKIFLDNLIHAPCPQVLYAVWILIISFIVFEILKIIRLIGQLSN